MQNIKYKNTLKYFTCSVLFVHTIHYKQLIIRLIIFKLEINEQNERSKHISIVVIVL